MGTPAKWALSQRIPHEAVSKSSEIIHIPRTGCARDRIDRLTVSDHACRTMVQEAMLDPLTEKQETTGTYKKSIENFVGTVKVPVGVAGPVIVNGRQHVIPLATTEAALVASVSRGCKAISMGSAPPYKKGGCAVVVTSGVTRCPAFEFSNLLDCTKFVRWVATQDDTFHRLTSETTKHGQFKEAFFTVEGKRVHLKLYFNTGDASGQNMVTFATKKIFDHIKKVSPVLIINSYLEGGMSSDKKPSHGTMMTVRGRSVAAEVIVPSSVVRSVLHTTPKALAEAKVTMTHGHMRLGAVGNFSGNPANVCAAVYIACGQDPACTSESSVGTVRFEVTDEGDLYASISMPDVMVATVGGGTGLPSQAACMRLINVANADELAEVLAVGCLASELSIVASHCSDEFAKAHHSLARGPTSKL
eukprot:TRINITY_DN5297_c0_g1_i2.p1 TRINITY_DN5297_c0_g1~~TRINITY_DN5297_c0_g1_i2.p1  ORF type:complete len:431 (+),score=74.22 TRINITY_DN5297_c0_g1_i2:45-1295(+)